MDAREAIEFSEELEVETDKLDSREFDEGSIEQRDPDRANYSRDYARLIYSSSFRRLQGKMQLLGVNQYNFHRNRLTHSLEVAQIARAIAEKFGLGSPVVPETCALGHDIGNPPFGHSGEKVLDELMSDSGGFEGNAQVMRVLRSLEKKSLAFNGLNLSLGTLLGFAKYFNKKGEGGNQRNFYMRKIIIF